MTESGLNEFDTPEIQAAKDELTKAAPLVDHFTNGAVQIANSLTASNTTETLRPRSNVQELPVLQQVEPISDIPQPLSSQTEQSELDKVEAAALSVVHSIEEKMELVQDVAIEGVQVVKAVNPIHVHISAGGGSVIKNPG